MVRRNFSPEHFKRSAQAEGGRMNLDEERESENVEDRRGFGRGGIAIGGGIGTLLIAVLALIFGVNPQQLLNGVGTADNPGPATQTGRAHAQQQEDDMVRL